MSREVLAEKFVSVLDGTFLPRRVGITEESIEGIKFMANNMVVKVFSAVVERKGFNIADTNITNKFTNGIGHGVGFLVWINVSPSFPTTAINKHSQHGFCGRENHEINFKVSVF